MKRFQIILILVFLITILSVLAHLPGEPVMPQITGWAIYPSLCNAYQDDYCDPDCRPGEDPDCEDIGNMMPGIPDSLFILSVILLLIISFILVEYSNRKKPKRKTYFKLNILKFSFIKNLIKNKFFRPTLRLLVLLIFIFIILAGFIGLQSADKNIAPLFTWTIWWAGLIFVILFLGKIFCFVCPWDTVAGFLQKFKKPKLKWPRHLRNIWLAIFLFVGLTWLELGYGITISPKYTALLGILMLILVLVPAIIFERKSFCRYGCLIGRISGLYSLFSPVEIRSKNKDVCRTCTTKDCFKGNEKGDPCPTSQCLTNMDSNTYCLLCTNCIKTCKKDNVALNIRQFAKDLIFLEKTRIDEAYLAIIMLSLTSFHGLTMTKLWIAVVNFIENITRFSYLSNFTIGMLLVILLPILVYYLFCRLTKIFARDKDVKTKTIFISFAYSFLPIALFYHLAHNLSHLLREGQKIIPLLSDPFGFGWNLFGTANMILKPIFSMPTIWYLQISLILIGHIAGIFICSKIAKKTFKMPLRAQVPILAAMILYSIFSLHLIAQPMIMRTFM